MCGEMYSEAVLTFFRPTPAVLSDIREILDGMSVVAVDLIESEFYPRDEVDCRGTLVDVMQRLEVVLTADYVETLRDCEKESWTFEYRVAESHFLLCGIDIVTRLVGPNEGGSIFYGRRVQRVAKETYLLWVDD